MQTFGITVSYYEKGKVLPILKQETFAMRFKGFTEAQAYVKRKYPWMKTFSLTNIQSEKVG